MDVIDDDVYMYMYVCVSKYVSPLLIEMLMFIMPDDDDDDDDCMSIHNNDDDDTYTAWYTVSAHTHINDDVLMKFDPYTVMIDDDDDGIDDGDTDDIVGVYIYVNDNDDDV